MNKTLDVLIVGAGPVGLFCANELARHNLSGRIIDKKATTSEHSKALGLHIRTLDVMEDCDFLKEIERQGHFVEGAVFYVKGKQLMQLDFRNIGSHRNYLIDLPQDKTEIILNDALHNKHMQVQWHTELIAIQDTEEGVLALIQREGGEKEEIKAKWVIACDGAHSTLRHLLGEEFDGGSYQQTWWLADIHIHWQNPENKMRIYVSEQGPLACFPMGNHRYRVVLTAPNGGTSNPTLSDIDSEFKRRTLENAELSDAFWISEFSIHHRQIKHYRRNRVFFAGDSAHIHSPMGGQGLNTGIQDIYNLVWKLALVEHGVADQSLLDSYHAERFPIGHDVLKKTHMMTKAILLRNPVLIALRNLFYKTIVKFKPVRKAIARDLAELSISYAKSPVVYNKPSQCHLKAGEFIGDFSVLNLQSNELEHIQSVVKGRSHNLLLFAGLEESSANSSELMTFTNKINQRLNSFMPIHLVAANARKKPIDYASVYEDVDNLVQHQLGIKRPTLVIIRPDKYIGAVIPGLNEQEFWHAVQKMGLSV